MTSSAAPLPRTISQSMRTWTSAQSRPNSCSARSIPRSAPAPIRCWRAIRISAAWLGSGSGGSGELHLMVEPVDPPPPIWESIKGKLKGVEQSPGAVRSDEPAISVEKTRATLEALEAQLREEGLDVPPTAAEAELPGLGATRAADVGGDLKPSGFHDQGVPRAVNRRSIRTGRGGTGEPLPPL